MGSHGLRLQLLVFAIASFAATASHAADETSSGDKLRMLYSNQFSFTDDGLPVVTIELANGEKQVDLNAAGGLLVRPDGESGATIDSASRWSITVENGQPAVLREWVVVARHHPDALSAIESELESWKRRGFDPKTFDIGTLFGVAGTVLDSRETLVAIAPSKPGRGGRRSRAIAGKFAIDTTVYTEIVRLPRGTVVAKSGKTTVTNPSVIWFAAKKPAAPIEVENILVGAGGSQLTSKRENRRYVGSIYATIGKDGKLVIVNAVASDRLLAGIVPSEIFASAPQAALEAQAVAARTELLEKLGRRHFGDPFLLCSTQQCQVYSGTGKEHPRTTAAVRATRGKVLVGRDNQLVDARYSAACGGFTSNKDSIWGGPPDVNLVGKIDAVPGTRSARLFKRGIDASNLESFLAAPESEFYEGRTRYGKGRFRWTREITANDLSKHVATYASQVGRVLSLEVIERVPSGRIRTMRIRGERGTATLTGDLTIRRALGGLRSALFAIDFVGPRERPTSFHFRGAGFGHGVGMCQTGAIGMAEEGRTAQEILDHYYTGASLKRIY